MPKQNHFCPVRAKTSISKRKEGFVKQSDMYTWSLTAHSVTNAGRRLASHLPARDWEFFPTGEMSS